MQPHDFPLSPPSLELATDRHPLTVAPETPVTEVLALLSQRRGYICPLRDRTLPPPDGKAGPPSSASCVLVVGGRQPVGIFTQRDIVKLAAKGGNLEGIAVADVMASPVIALRQAPDQNIFAALSLLRQHRIRHLPVVGDGGALVGLVTSETICASLEPVNLLKLRQVAEVMATVVVTAPPTASLQQVAGLIAERQVSCVAIVQRSSGESPDLTLPLGIVTEGDIVQFQALQLPLAEIQAQQVMSAPVFCISPFDSLWKAQQEMQRRDVGRLAVTGSRGELLGVITRTRLLALGEPVQMYSIAHTLQQQVSQLKAEKFQLLRNRNAELELQVRARTAELQQQAERERLLAQVASRIRQSLNLQEILNATVTEVRQLLQCDRVVVYQLDGSSDGTIVAESVAPGWPVALDSHIQETCFRLGTVAEEYRKGRKRAIADVRTAGLTDCHLQMLERFQVRAKLVAPILIEEARQQPDPSPTQQAAPNRENSLWGLLIAHQCGDPRQWQAPELELLDRLSVQIAIAIQQAQLFERIRSEQEALQNLVAGTAGVTGEDFFPALARHLALALGVRHATVAEKAGAQLQGKAFWSNNQMQPALTYQIAGTPCELALARGIYACRERVQQHFPNAPALAVINAESYLGVALTDSAGLPIGLICILDSQPLPDRSRAEAILRVFAARAAAELERQRSTRALQQLNQELEIRVQERTAELARVIDQLQQEIAEREQAQKEALAVKERLQYLLSTSPTAIYSCKPGEDFAASFISSNIRALLGYDAQDFLEDSSFWSNRVHPEDLPGLFAGLPSLFQNGTHTNESRFSHADGTYRWLQNDMKLVLDSAGTPLEIVGSLTDITHRVQAEEQLQKALKELEFQTVALDRAAIVAITDRQGVITYVNDKFCKISQYSREELLGNTHRCLRSGYHSKEFFREMWATISSGQVWKGEIRNRAKDGSFYWMDSTIVPFLDSQGNPYQYLALRFDITQRKQAEAQLLEVSQLQHAILDGASYMITSTRADTTIQTFNAAAARLLGYAPEEVIGKATLALFHDPEELERRAAIFADLGRGIPNESEWTYIRKDGSRFPVLLSLGALRDEKGNITGFFGMASDITERVEAAKREAQAQEALRESEERLRLALQAAGTVSWEWNILTGQLIYSEQVEPAFGFAAGTYPGTLPAFLEIVHPEDREKFLRSGLRSMQQKRDCEQEFRIAAPDGTVRWVENKGKVYLDATGRPVRMLGVAMNITNRKRSEEQLLQKTSELEAIFAASPDLYFRLSGEATILDCKGGNIPDLCAVPAALPGQPVRAALPAGAGEILHSATERVLLEKKPVSTEFSLTFSGGEQHYEARLMPFLQGQAIAIVRNITDRKQAEAVLRSTQDRLQSLLASSPTSIYSCSAEGDFGATFMSDNSAGITGYTPEEFLSYSGFWADRIHPEDKARVFAELPQLFERGHHTHEYRFLHKNGTYLWMRDELRLVCDAAGKPVEIVGSWTDITERKQADEALQRSNQLLRVISAAQSQFIASADPRILFDGLLDSLLSLTGSEYGFIGEILYAADGTPYVESAHMKMRGRPYLKIHAITNIAWNEEIQKLYEGNAGGGMEFHNLKTLFGAVIATGAPVIANTPDTDPRRGGLPEGHPPIRTFLGLPLYMDKQLIGMVGVANRPSGYDWHLVEYLQPFLSTCANIREAHRNDQRRQIAEQGLKQQLAAMEAASDGIAILNQDSEFIYLNTAHLHLFGYQHLGGLVGKTWRELYCPDEIERIERDIFPLIQQNGHWRGEATAKRCDGSTFAEELSLTFIEGVGLVCVCQDITERKLAEAQLKAAKEQLEAVLDAVPGFVSWVSSDLRYLGANRHLAATFNLSPEDFAGKKLGFLENSPDFADSMRQFFAGDSTATSQVFDVEIGGATRNYLIVAQKYQKGTAAVSVGIDITERQQAEEQLKASLQEKELLLKEVHHRVKNNLQVICSIFSLQSQYIKDTQILSVLEDSQNRIRSMALIHEKLYQSDTLAKIDFGEYVRSLANSLLSSYNVSTHLIRTRVRVDSVSLTLDTAIPCGLIINELVSNSLKHAFPNGMAGEISIDLSVESEGEMGLTVRDNGVGLPEGFDFKKNNSLGLRLVRALTRQIQGNLNATSAGGACFEITFPIWNKAVC
ncbi:PAS domain S-box protein [Kamptonema formosum]|uniref:PAS domain S-box protein n=1 Tax=Kamptonema formosum TaxID=331992 RepID=UPI000344D262|nr:PAS domain S-box protein [Oscillatoria sp. PCC 10802]